MILVASGRIAQFFLALVMVRVATTVLSPEEMGKVSLILASIAFFAFLLINPVGTFINRRLHAWQRTGVAKEYLIRYAAYLFIVSLVAASVLVGLYTLGILDFGVPLVWLFFLVSGSLLFNTINQTSIPSLNLLGDSKRFVFYSILTVASSLICAFLLVEELYPAAQYWVFGLLLGQTIFAAIGTRSLFRLLDQADVTPPVLSMNDYHFQALVKFAWPVAIAATLGWVQAQGYRYIMEDHLGLAALGLFVAGYGLSAGLIAGFEAILTTYFQPRLYRDVSPSHSEHYGEAWKRYASAIIPSLILTVALIASLAPELTRMLLGAHFQTAVDYVVWGAFAEAARVLVGVYSLIAHVYMRTSWLVFPSLVGALSSILLILYLIPHLGPTGVGVGLTLSGVVVVMTLHYMLIDKVGGGLPVRPMLLAVFAALLLWGGSSFARGLLDIVSWWEVIGFLVVVGGAYMLLQYLFIRPHLVETK